MMQQTAETAQCEGTLKPGSIGSGMHWHQIWLSEKYNLTFDDSAVTK